MSRDLRGQALVDLAHRFIAVAAARDIEGMRALYHPDLIMWHNTDQLELSREEHLESYVRNNMLVKAIHYSNIRVTPFENGYVQQHSIRAEIEGGREMNIACCLVARVEDGKIKRLEEYYDSGAFHAAGLVTPEH